MFVVIVASAQKTIWTFNKTIRLAFEVAIRQEFKQSAKVSDKTIVWGAPCKTFSVATDVPDK